MTSGARVIHKILRCAFFRSGVFSNSSSICKSHLTYKFYLHTHVIYIVLKETEVIALKRSNEGFNEINFTTGVLNCFLIVYIVGAYPQHLWLLYFIESFYMVSTIIGTFNIFALYTAWFLSWLCTMIYSYYTCIILYLLHNIDTTQILHNVVCKTT